MAILGLQGIRGGVGATSITAALAWSLQLLGESVLVIDACPDNMLRLSFNDDIDRHSGWARAVIDGQDWRDTALRYTAQIDVLPFGKLQASDSKILARWAIRSRRLSILHKRYSARGAISGY